MSSRTFADLHAGIGCGRGRFEVLGEPATAILPGSLGLGEVLLPRQFASLGLTGVKLTCIRWAIAA